MYMSAMPLCVLLLPTATCMYVYVCVHDYVVTVFLPVCWDVPLCAVIVLLCVCVLMVSCAPLCWLLRWCPMMHGDMCSHAPAQLGCLGGSVGTASAMHYVTGSNPV